MLSPRSLLIIARRHYRLSAVCIAAVLAGSLWSISRKEPVYESHMKLLVKRERADPLLTSGVSGTPTPVVTEEDLNSEVELLLSSDLLERVVVRCDLARDNAGSGFRAQVASLFGRPLPDTPETRTALATRALAKAVSIKLLKKTNLIQVSYTSRSPKRAAEVMNVLADEYLRKHLAVHRPSGSVRFFEEATDRYFRELQAANGELTSFEDQQGVVVAEAEKQNALQKAAEFEAAVRTNNAQIHDKAERVRFLQEQMARSTPRVATQTRNADNPALLEHLKSSLLNNQVKRAGLAMKFREDYPPIRELDEQIALIRGALAAEHTAPVKDETTDVNPTYQWLTQELVRCRADLVSAEAQKRKLEEAAAAYQQRALDLSRKEMMQHQLMRTVKTTEANYLLNLNKLEESRIADQLDEKRIINVAIAEPPRVPALPSGPPVYWSLAAGVVCALIAGVAAAALAERMASTFRSRAEAAEILEMPVFAVLPRAGHGVSR